MSVAGMLTTSETLSTMIPMIRPRTTTTMIAVNWLYSTGSMPNFRRCPGRKLVRLGPLWNLSNKP